MNIFQNALYFSFLEDREKRHACSLHLLSKTKPKTPNIVCSVPALAPNKEENESTSKEQDKKSPTEEPKGMSTEDAVINPNGC